MSKKQIVLTEDERCKVAAWLIQEATANKVLMDQIERLNNKTIADIYRWGLKYHLKDF